MDYLNEIFEKTKQAGKFVCDKAVDAKDYVALEYKAIKLRSDIDAQYKELGRIVYEASVTEGDQCGDSQVYIDKISALRSELDTVYDEMSKFKNICPSCKNANQQNAAFCSKCGNALK